MDAIEQIIKKIDLEAQNERKELKEQETKRIETHRLEEKKRIQEKAQTQLKKQMEQLEKEFRQKQNRQIVENRQKKLRVKQTFLHQLFTEAVQVMSAWPEKEFQDFCSDALKQLSLTGAIRLIPGEQSKAYFTEEWINRLNQELPYRLEYQEEGIKDAAGFLLEDKGVQYNFLFENLVTEMQKTLSYELSQEVFD